MRCFLREKGETELQTGLTSSNFEQAYCVVCCSFPVPITLKQKLPSYTKRFKSENSIYMYMENTKLGELNKHTVLLDKSVSVNCSCFSYKFVYSPTPLTPSLVRQNN